MVGHKKKSNAKRHAKTGKNALAKRQRKQFEMWKITDVNNDCLENIFKYLNLDDLLNVVDANKWLRVAADYVYRRRYGQRIVELCDLNSKKTGYIQTNNKSPKIAGLKKCLRFVRCFGHNIYELKIDYCRSSRKDYTYLDQYVNEFCADSLTHIKYIRKSTILLEIPEKPFTKLEILGIIHSNLGNRFEEIMKWFPKLRRLYMDSNRMDGNSVEVNIPNLEHLIVTLNSGKKYIINHKNVIEAVRLNPQLRSLFIRQRSKDLFPFTNVLEIANINPSIASLAIHQNSAQNTVGREQLFQLVTALPFLGELLLNSCTLQSNDVIQFVRQATNLKMFCFKIDEPKDLQIQELITQLNDEWQIEEDMRLVEIFGEFMIRMERKY